MRVQSIESQRVKHDWSDLACMHVYLLNCSEMFYMICTERVFFHHHPAHFPPHEDAYSTLVDYLLDLSWQQNCTCSIDQTILKRRVYLEHLCWRWRFQANHASSQMKSGYSIQAHNMKDLGKGKRKSGTWEWALSVYNLLHYLSAFRTKAILLYLVTLWVENSGHVLAKGCFRSLWHQLRPVCGI